MECIIPPGMVSEPEQRLKVKESAARVLDVISGIGQLNKVLTVKNKSPCIAPHLTSSSSQRYANEGSPNYIVKSPRGFIPIPEDVTVSGLLLSRFSQAPDKTALVDYNSGETLSYSQLGDKVKALAASLYKYGVRKGTTVSLCSSNSLQAALLLLSIPATGACVATINSQLTKGDMEKLLDMGSIEYLITTADLLPNFANRMNTFRKVFTIGKTAGFMSVQDLLEEGDPRALPVIDIDPRRDPVVMPFSSGTTGLPKGVLLSHYNVVSSIIAACTPFLGSELYSSNDVIVSVFPFAHIGGIVSSLMYFLYSLSTAVLMEKFDFEEYLRANEKYKATMMMMPPPVAVRLLNDPLVDRYDLSSVKAVVSGAAPISDVLQEGLCRRLNINSFTQAYGLTETTGVTHMDQKTNCKIGSVGFLLPNVMAKIMDADTGADLPSTSTGEICIKGPMVMMEYLNNPQSTARTKDSQGWIRTGDIGHHDQEGYLYVTDRCKDLIKFKGFQVAPAELEGMLLGHTLVADAAVIGVPDERAGEVPRAFVVLQQGAAPTHDTELDIIQYVKDRVAPFKQLRGGVCFVDVIPKLASGKILRRLLRQQVKTALPPTTQGVKSKL